MTASGGTRRLGWLLSVIVAGSALAGEAAPPAKAKPDREPAKRKKSPTTRPAKKAAPVRHRKPPVKKVELTTRAADEEKRTRVAHVRLSGTVTNRPPDFELFSLGEPSSVTLRQWLHRLAAIRRDDRIEAVAVEVGTPGLSWAHAQELCDALRRLDAVKPVHAHLVYGGSLSYLLASAAREVSMDPAGRIMMTGLATELTFFRGTLDLLGIQPQFVQIGRYKGASEPFARKEPSREFRGQYNKVLDDLYDQLCGQIARQRKLKVSAVRRAIDAGPLGAAGARRHKLVDRLETKRQWYTRLGKQLAGKGRVVQWSWNHGKKKKQTVDFSNPFALLGMLMKGSTPAKVHDPSIAIIHADGMIVRGKSGQSLFGGRLAGSRTLTACFQEAADNDRIKAVVFRIDSPGGSAIASELIHQAVRHCAKKKPVVASIARLGASGGYYVAVGADTILADPCALTGSIGVVSGKLALKGLYKKIGVTTYEMTRGRHAGLGLSRKWTDREQAVIRKLTQETYDTFVARVKASRGQRIRDIDKVAQGRIFTARQAVACGLIDRVGGMREAVALAKQRAKIGACGYLTLPRPKSLMDLLGGGFSTQAPAAWRTELLLLRRLAARRPAVGYLLQFAELLEDEAVLTGMPYHVSVRP